MLVTQDEIVNIVRHGQAEGKTFVVTNGCFDILHVGHPYPLSKLDGVALCTFPQILHLYSICVL